MPTQIAATPIIRGKEAKKIYHSSKAEIGAKKLAMKFDMMLIISSVDTYRAIIIDQIGYGGSW